MCARGKLTSPKTEQILGVPDFNRAHRIVFNAHNGAVGVEGHDCAGRYAGRRAGGCKREREKDWLRNTVQRKRVMGGNVLEWEVGVEVEVVVASGFVDCDCDGW